MKMYYWLSFANREDGWLGGAVVQCDSAVESLFLSHILGINPGGEMLATPFLMPVPPPEGALNRLFTDKDEMNRLADEWHAAARAEHPVGD